MIQLDLKNRKNLILLGPYLRSILWSDSHDKTNKFIEAYNPIQAATQYAPYIGLFITYILSLIVNNL